MSAVSRARTRDARAPATTFSTQIPTPVQISQASGIANLSFTYQGLNQTCTLVGALTQNGPIHSIPERDLQLHRRAQYRGVGKRYQDHGAGHRRGASPRPALAADAARMRVSPRSYIDAAWACARRRRTHSNSTTAAAAAALSDSAPPGMGMVMRASGFVQQRRGEARAFVADRDGQACAAVPSRKGPRRRGPTVAITRPLGRNARAQATRSTSSTIAVRKCAPCPARNTLGDHANAQCLDNSTCSTPAAAAVRSMAPTLPGSCTSSSRR